MVNIGPGKNPPKEEVEETTGETIGCVKLEA